MGLVERILKLFKVYSLYEKWLLHQIKDKSLPQHVGIILDGNRRWAYERALEPWVGHRYGADKVEELLDWCLRLGINTLTLYTFSIENFQRPKNEVEAILKLMEEKLLKLSEDPKLYEHEVRVKLIGRRDLLPPKLKELAERVEEKTKDFNRHFLNIAVAYGGRAEIVEAIKNIAYATMHGELKPEEIDENLVERYLYTSHLLNPHPDLIIRTSGEERLSGFLLWQSAYSELCFLDVYWPDFRKIDLLRAIRVYQSRKRRFGL